MVVLIRLSKNRYHMNNIKQAEGNNKLLWHSINEITNRKTTKTKILPDIVDKKTLADEMTDYFSKIGSDNIVNNDSNNEATKVINENLLLTPIEDIEIKRIIHNLNKTKSKGPDNIELLFIKRNCESLIIPIKHIINCSFKAGIFPESLK